MGLLSPGLPALAAPSASQLSSEISKDNEQITEKYNGAEVQLKADQKLQSTLSAQLGPLQLDASIAHQQISAIAQQLYMSGGSHTMEALLGSDSTITLLDALGALNQMARGQKAKIDDDTVRVKAFSSKKATQDALVAKDQALVTSLNADKKKILANIATLTKLQDELPPPPKKTATGGGGGGGGGSGGGNLGGGPYTKAEIMPYACPRSPGSGKGAIAVKKACALLWQPSKSPPWTMYHWAQASNSAGYDCSGFTMTAWEAAGVDLDHFTGAQWKATAGKRPTRSTLQPGDLVFYYGDHHHVAIYIGDGWIAQAEETGQPLKESPLGSPSGYGRPH